MQAVGFSIEPSKYEVVNSALQKEASSTQWHAPYHNYLGPGTKIITNLVNDVAPVDSLDHAAMIHDIEYFKGDNKRADYNMKDNLGGVGWPILGVLRLANILGLAPIEVRDPDGYRVAKQLYREKYPNSGYRFYDDPEDDKEYIKQVRNSRYNNIRGRMKDDL